MKYHLSAHNTTKHTTKKREECAASKINSSEIVAL
jgi:hypothetical protein